MSAVQEHRFWECVINENMGDSNHYARIGDLPLFEHFYEQASHAYGEQKKCETAAMVALCLVVRQSREVP